MSPGVPAGFGPPCEGGALGEVPPERFLRGFPPTSRHVRSVILVTRNSGVLSSSDSGPAQDTLEAHLREDEKSRYSATAIHATW